MIAHDGYPLIFVKLVNSSYRYQWYIHVMYQRETLAQIYGPGLYKTPASAKRAARRAWDRLMKMGAEMNRGGMV